MKHKLLYATLFTLLLVCIPAIRSNDVLALGGGIGCTASLNRTDNYPMYSFTGWQYPPINDGATQTIGGDQAQIEAYSNWYGSSLSGKTTVNATDAEWVMLTNDIGSNNPTGAEYAQVGLMTGPGEAPSNFYAPSVYASSPITAPYIFVQYTQASGGSIMKTYPLDTITDGSLYWFDVLFNSNGQGQNVNNEWAFTYTPPGGNTTVLLTVGPSGGSNKLGWTPTQAETFGETHSQADQMFGDVPDPVTFYNSEYWLSGWTAMNTSGEATPPFDQYATDVNNVLTNWTQDPDDGYQVGSTSQLSIYDIGCPQSPQGNQTDALVNGGLYDVLDTIGPQSNPELESNSGDRNGPFYWQAQYTTSNFLEVDNSGYVIWTPAVITGAPTYSIMQSDCNYVIYDGWGQSALFNTGTNGHGSGCALVMEDSGNLDLFNSSGTLLWSDYGGWDSSDVNGDPDALLYGQTLVQGGTLYSPTGGYFLTLQSDGNLVLYNSSGTALWDSWAATGKDGVGECLTEQASDGNLVLYPNSNCSGTAVWNAGTEGTGGYDHMLVNPQGTFGVQEDTQSGNQFAWQS